VRIDLAETARDVAPAAALRWWADFQDGREDHGFVPGQRRTIVAREGSRVTMVDKAPMFRERTTARVLDDRVEFEGENTVSRFEGVYAFEPAEGGTSVRLSAVIRLRAGVRWLRPLARPLARGVLRADLRGHVREMERDVKQQAIGRAEARGRQ
jgi:hypothetical protein